MAGEDTYAPCALDQGHLTIILNVGLEYQNIWIIKFCQIFWIIETALN